MGYSLKENKAEKGYIKEYERERDRQREKERETDWEQWSHFMSWKVSMKS
jgi:hypothetical protein